MVVYICTSYSDFYTALTGLASDDVIIINNNSRIEIPASGIDTSYTSRYFHILQLGSQAILDFSAMQWDKPGDPGVYGRTRNGLALSLKGFTLLGGQVYNYQEIGDCIKPNVTEYFTIAGVLFNNVGSRKWPYRPGVAPGNIVVGDAIYNVAIGSHPSSGTTGVGTIIGNRFQGCMKSEAQWSHCIYVNHKMTNVFFNDFDDCGSPFSVYPGWTGNRGLLFGNAGRNWALAQRPTGDIRPTLLSGQAEHMYHFGNHYSGLFQYIGNSLYNVTGSARFFSDFNNFARSLYNGPYGFAGIDGSWVSLVNYLASWDTHSTGLPKAVTTP